MIIGLGNKGQEYANTRHNVGFLFLDWLLQSKYGISFSYEKACTAYVALYENMVFVKPKSHMNQIGKAVRDSINHFGVQKENIIVVHDDLEQNLGKYKIQ